MWRVASFSRLHPKLLLSYLVVLIVSVGVTALAIGLIGPGMFDRLLDRHMGMHGHGAGRMSEATRQETRDVFGMALYRSLLIASGVATGAAILVSAFVAWRITQPMERIATASRRIARGDYHERVEVGSNDELGELATSFNEMAAALEQAERQRVYLIGDVAHEIRTPLTTLRGNLEGMIDGVIAPEPELLARLYDETSRMQRLIDDLQELSRVESGTLPLNRALADPLTVISSSAAALETAFVARGVALVVDLPESLPPCTIDVDRIVQVLTNLLTNALRHTPDGGSVTVRARFTNEAVEISIADTGSGIAPEHLPRIFDRFYRADRSRARQSGGSGIGLTIARALVEAHGGLIRASSPGLDQGTTMTVVLPVA